MNHFVSWVAQQEIFIIQQISMSFLLMVAFYLLLFFGLKWTEKKVFYRFVLVLISIVMLQTVFIFEKYTAQSADEFIVFNQSKASTVGKRNGNLIRFDTSTDSLKAAANFKMA
jgi:competence protein ComEC